MQISSNMHTCMTLSKDPPECPIIITNYHDFGVRLLRTWTKCNADCFTPVSSFTSSAYHLGTIYKSVYYMKTVSDH